MYKEQTTQPNGVFLIIDCQVFADFDESGTMYILYIYIRSE